MLEIEKLTVCFGDRCVLDAVSMSVKRGEVLGIVGESGFWKDYDCAVRYGAFKPAGADKRGQYKA